MAQDKDLIIGLDIGSTKTCCIIAQRDEKFGEMKFLGGGTSSSTGIKKGTVIHIDQTIQSIEKAVQKAEEMANIKIDHAIVGISGEHIRSLNMQGAIAVSRNGHHSDRDPEITNNDITKVLEMAKAISLPVNREILHILPQEYVVDEQGGIKDPLGMVGRRLEARVHLITGAVSAERNITKCVEEAGLSLDAIVYQPLAASASTLDIHERELGVALINLGGGTTDVSVFYEGAIRHSTVIGVGGYNVTNDLAVILKISAPDAEDIKIKYGSAKASMASPDYLVELPFTATETPRQISEQELALYIEARMREIFQLAKREIVRADIVTPLTFGVVLTGGGALLKNITSLAEEIFGMPVKIGIPKGLTGTTSIIASPVYSTAVGLLQYDSLISKEFNLGIQEEPVMKQTFQRIKNWFGELF